MSQTSPRASNNSSNIGLLTSEGGIRKSNKIFDPSITNMSMNNMVGGFIGDLTLECIRKSVNSLIWDCPNNIHNLDQIFMTIIHNTEQLVIESTKLYKFDPKNTIPITSGPIVVVLILETLYMDMVRYNKFWDVRYNEQNRIKLTLLLIALVLITFIHPEASHDIEIQSENCNGSILVTPTDYLRIKAENDENWKDYKINNLFKTYDGYSNTSCILLPLCVTHPNAHVAAFNQFSANISGLNEVIRYIRERINRKNVPITVKSIILSLITSYIVNNINEDMLHVISPSTHDLITQKIKYFHYTNECNGSEFTFEPATHALFNLLDSQKPVNILESIGRYINKDDTVRNYLKQELINEFQYFNKEYLSNQTLQLFNNCIKAFNCKDLSFNQALSYVINELHSAGDKYGIAYCNTILSIFMNKVFDTCLFEFNTGGYFGNLINTNNPNQDKYILPHVPLKLSVRVYEQDESGLNFLLYDHTMCLIPDSSKDNYGPDVTNRIGNANIGIEEKESDYFEIVKDEITDEQIENYRSELGYETVIDEINEYDLNYYELQYPENADVGTVRNKYIIIDPNSSSTEIIAAMNGDSKDNIVEIRKGRFRLSGSVLRKALKYYEPEDIPDKFSTYFLTITLMPVMIDNYDSNAAWLSQGITLPLSLNDTDHNITDDNNDCIELIVCRHNFTGEYIILKCTDKKTNKIYNMRNNPIIPECLLDYINNTRNQNTNRALSKKKQTLVVKYPSETRDNNVKKGQPRVAKFYEDLVGFTEEGEIVQFTGFKHPNTTTEDLKKLYVLDGFRIDPVMAYLWNKKLTPTLYALGGDKDEINKPVGEEHKFSLKEYIELLIIILTIASVITFIIIKCFIPWAVNKLNEKLNNKPNESITGL
jgi:hypothetical protein